MERAQVGLGEIDHAVADLLLAVELGDLLAQIGEVGADGGDLRGVLSLELADLGAEGGGIIDEPVDGGVDVLAGLIHEDASPDGARHGDCDSGDESQDQPAPNDILDEAHDSTSLDPGAACHWAGSTGGCGCSKEVVGK